MDRNLAIFSHLLTLFAIWSVANGLCFPEHPQTAVCRAKFVVKAKIISIDWERDSMTTTKKQPTTASTATTEEPDAATTMAVTTTSAESVPSTVAPPIVERTTMAAFSPLPNAKDTETVLSQTTKSTINQEQTEASIITRSNRKVTSSDGLSEKKKEKKDRGNERGDKPGTGTTNRKPAKTSSRHHGSSAALTAYQASYFLRPKIIRIEIKKLFKGLTVVNTEVGKQTNVIFASPHRTHLKVGKTYLLTGRNIGDRLMTNECNWHAEWESLTMTQLHGLRRYYWLYCRCQIKFCPAGRCDRDLRSCTWVVPLSAIDAKKADLLSSFSVCMVRCGACGFYNPRQTVDCIYPNSN